MHSAHRRTRGEARVQRRPAADARIGARCLFLARLLRAGFLAVLVVAVRFLLVAVPAVFAGLALVMGRGRGAVGSMGDMGRVIAGGAGT
jgi:hypothetical protein